MPLPRREKQEAQEALFAPIIKKAYTKALQGKRKPSLPLAGGRNCWCGEKQGHDWPGKAQQAPHPR